MAYEELRKRLVDYNWDDGFDLPRRITDDKNCDLAMALEVFYLADGYAYLLDHRQDGHGNLEWFCFIETLFEEIKSGRYLKTEHPFQIPLTKTQRYRLAKQNIPEIFLNDVSIPV